MPGRIAPRLRMRAGLVRATGFRHAARRLRDRQRREVLDEGRSEVYREIWREAAGELDAELVELGSGFLELRLDGRRTRVRERYTMLDDAVTLEIALDKTLSTRLLADAGVPIPAQVELHRSALADAVSFLEREASACVVKPARGTAGGAGVTTGVRTPAELRRTLGNAALWDSRVLLERQAEGDVYRLLFLDGELLDVVRRGRPTVTGDGRSTMDELIAAENDRRVEQRGRLGLDLLAVDFDCVFELAQAGLGLRTVLPAGERVAVKRVTNESCSHDNETVRAGVCDELVGQARDAVGALGLRLAGVDVITLDPALPLQENGGVVVEVNGTPGLTHHYQVAEPARATRVAVPILRAALASSDRTALELSLA